MGGRRGRRSGVALLLLLGPSMAFAASRGHVSKHHLGPAAGLHRQVTNGVWTAALQSYRLRAYPRLSITSQERTQSRRSFELLARRTRSRAAQERRSAPRLTP